MKASIKPAISKLNVFYKENKRKFWILTSVCFAVFALLFLVLFSAADTKTKSKSTSTNIPYLQDSCIWAKEQLKKMSPEEKAAQLLWIEINLNESASISSSINLLKDIPLGGVVFSTGTPNTIRRFIKQLQQNSTIPYFTAADAEFGMQEKKTT